MRWGRFRSTCCRAIEAGSHMESNTGILDALASEDPIW
jgi:hypothetical protein